MISSDDPGGRTPDGTAALRARPDGNGRRIVLYSCHYGTAEPYHPDAFGAYRGRWPCLVFSDDPALPVPEGVTLVPDPLCGLDARRASRRAKLMPDRYLPPCDWSVYVDNKIRIMGRIERLIDHLASQPGPGLFVPRHPDRQCLYDEGEVCIAIGKEAPDRIRAQLAQYQSLGFPRNAGLPHAGFLVRRHGSPALRRFGEVWFEHVLAHSRRDQVSFPFVAWALDIRPVYFDPIFEGTRLYEVQEAFAPRPPPPARRQRRLSRLEQRLRSYLP